MSSTRLEVVQLNNNFTCLKATVILLIAATLCGAITFVTLITIH